MRKAKILLLLSSLVCLVLLIAAALEENRFGPWRGYQADYRAVAVAKASDDKARRAAERMEIGFRQLFLPDLNRVDRCTTCHIGIDDPRMAGAQQPLRAHSGNVFKHHPVDKFGCTVCHDGQGRAVTEEAAHGEVEHWPEPLLRGELTYTSCSRCHHENDLYGWEEDMYTRAPARKPINQAELFAAVPGIADARYNPIVRGKQLMLEFGCLGCHKYKGRGGTLGPDITYVGDKTAHDFDFTHVEGEHTIAGWLSAHFKEPGEVAPGTLMPDLDLTDQQVRELTLYMLSLRRKDMPATHTPIPARHATKGAGGGQLYTLFCSACHGRSGLGATVRNPAMLQVVDAPRELMTPSLNNPDTLAVASDDYLRRIITTGRSGTSMIGWKENGGLRPEEIDRLVAFIRSWQASGPARADISASRGNPHYGRRLYQARCMACHGRNGEGTVGGVALNTPAFLAVASDEFLRDTIVYGRANTAMPSWKELKAVEVSDLIAYIRTWQGRPPDKQAVLAKLAGANERSRLAGETLYQTHCATCHGSEGEGALGPSLNNDAFLSIVDDEYLYAAIIDGRPGTAMPTWKHLKVDEVADLIQYLRTWNKGRRRRLEPFVAQGDWDEGLITYRGTCAGCHGTYAEGGTGPQLNDPVFLATASDAMLREWISFGKAGTPMRGFLRGRQGLVDLTASQIEDVITYLRRFDFEPREVAARAGIGVASLGEEVFADSCVDCHGPDEEEAMAVSLCSPDFLSTVPDGYLEATLVLERSMPALELSVEDISNVVAFMRGWQYEPPDAGRVARYVLEADLSAGEELFGSFCSGCHGIEGKGGWASELNNHEFLAAATDGFLEATIVRGRSNTAMRRFGMGGGGVAELSSDEIANVVAYIRTWAGPEHRPSE